MARGAVRPILGGFIALVLLLTPLAPLQATELAWLNWPGRDSRSSAPNRSLKSRLQEVAPPEAVQAVRRRLEKRRPNLRLVSPSDEAVITTDCVHLVLQVEDWPLEDASDHDIGPHVAIQIDERPPVRVSSLDGNEVHLDVKDLQPGSHRFSAWAAYPWGEAVKRPGAAINWRLHLWDKLEGTQPGRDDPWLVPIEPSAWHKGDPLLLDWLIWNAPLQNLRADDQRWTLRLSLNGQTIRLAQQESIWLKGATDSNGITVQMELLDELGEPIAPVFNNRLLHLTASGGERPVWLKNNVSDREVRRLSGEPLDNEPDMPSEGEELLAEDDNPVLEEEPGNHDADQAQIDISATPDPPATDATVAQDPDTAAAKLDSISSSPDPLDSNLEDDASAPPRADEMEIGAAEMDIVIDDDTYVNDDIDAVIDPETVDANPNAEQESEPPGDLPEKPGNATANAIASNEPSGAEGSSLGGSEDELGKPS